MDFVMQIIILVFCLSIFIILIKDMLTFIYSFITENALLVIGVGFVIILFCIIKTYVENKNSSLRSKEKLNSEKTRQVKKLSNVDIIFKSGYRYNFEKERWEHEFNNDVVAYISALKKEHKYTAGFLYDKYDMAAEDSFSTILDAKKWADTFYPVFTEGKIESYLNNGKFDSIITVRVNNASSSNKETVPSTALSTYTENVIDTDLPEQNNACENGNYNQNTQLSTPIFTDLTIEGDIDNSNLQNEGNLNLEGETDVDEHLFTSVSLSASQRNSPKTDVTFNPYLQLSGMGKAFYASMKRFENKTVENASFCEFFAYYPTYGDMTNNQKKWYFYWRRKVRNNSYPETSLSYIFLYVYELLCDIGVQDKTDGFNKLMAVWKNYRHNYPSLDGYLSEWVFDYCQIHNLPYEPMPFDDITILNDIVINRLIERHSNEHPLKLPLYLIKGLSDYKIEKSKFYKSHEQLMNSAIFKVTSLTDMFFWQKEHKGLFEKYGPTKMTTISRKVYFSTMFTDMTQICTYKDYTSTKELRDIITGLIKFTENVLRTIEGVGGRVKTTEAIQRHNELQSIIRLFLNKKYGTSRIESKPDTTEKNDLINSPHQADSTTGLDFNKIEKLRKESDNVREILEVQREDEEKVLLTDIAGMQMVLANISDQSRTLLYSLRENGWVDRYDSSMELLMDEINRISLKYLSQDLLIVDSDSNITVEEDFRDEIDYIWQSNNTDMPMTSDDQNHDTADNGSDNQEFDKGTVFSYTGCQRNWQGV
ncbi:MAG: TerB N-terminal domain-containing protein [Lachnospira sp.]|nr:TerB N-terminal domain-containing protein [Lachnospira sp.]